MNGGMTLCRTQIKQSLQSLSWLSNDFFHQKKREIDLPIQRYREQLFLREVHPISCSSYPLL